MNTVACLIVAAMAAYVARQANSQGKLWHAIPAACICAAFTVQAILNLLP